MASTPSNSKSKDPASTPAKTPAKKATPTAATKKPAAPTNESKTPEADAAKAKKRSTPSRTAPAGTKNLPDPHTVNAPPKIRPAKPGTKKIQPKEILELRQKLLEERETLIKVVRNLHNDALEQAEGFNAEEDGTEISSQLFNLNSASKNEIRIRQIDEAIRAIDEGSYGYCTVCGNMINPERLRFLPDAKTCIRCQSEADSQNTGRVSFRHRL